MNIWSWVYNKSAQLEKEGQHRLVELIENIPHWTVNQQHEKVDAYIPEALALTRGLNEKWLELFFRHWHLQSRVLHRNQVKQALPEAVSLLDFSHTGNNQECPQSICIIQDLANCYGQADGPGYYEERIAVASETLAKIDVSWPCYSCISAEYVTALIDNKQYAEALEFLDECDKALIASGQGKDTSELLQNRITVLIKLSRFSEARKLSKQLQSWGGGSAFKFSVRLSKAKIDAFDGQADLALKHFPAFDEVINNPSEYFSWCEIAHQLVKLDKFENNWELGKQFEKIISTLYDYGAVREALDSAFLAADLATLRGRRSTVDYLIQFIQRTIPELNRLCGADTTLASLRKRVEETTFNDINITAPDALTTIRHTMANDPELALEYINKLSRQSPTSDSQLASGELDCLLQLERRQQAITRAFELLDKNLNSSVVLLKLNDLAGNDTSILNKFVNRLHELELNQENQQHLLSIQAKHYYSISDFEKAKSFAAQFLEFDSDCYSTRRFLAGIERRLENYNEALKHTTFLLKQHPEEKELCWDHILFSSLLENWNDIIPLAAQLGLSVDGDGPEYAEWELCRIQTRLPDGRSTTSTARRVGPVTAKITSVSHSDYPQQYGDLVIFDPQPINSLSELNEQDDAIDHEGEQTLLYNTVKTISSHHYTNYFLQGVHPTEDELKSLEEQLARLDVPIIPFGNADYKIYDYNKEDYISGFFAYILLSPATDRAEVSTLLNNATKSFTAPLFWLLLAKDARQEKIYQEQLELAEDFDFED